MDLDKKRRAAVAGSAVTALIRSEHLFISVGHDHDLVGTAESSASPRGCSAGANSAKMPA